MENLLRNVVVVLTVVVIAMLLAGCSGSAFMALGGSGAFYNPNNEHAPKIVQQQPTQSIAVGRAKILPMVGGK